jgi:hypothetical protein
MSKRRKNAKDKSTYAILAAIVTLAAGYYLLNHVATWEDPPLGNTFYIIAGCILIAAGVIAAVLIIKARFFPKRKKKKGSRPVFLNDVQEKEKRK